ncbi:ATP-grasp domain-containing protein [Emticicia sp. 17c]|uniref:ATP-grasp domain-containing protein n=1 Tax=Emticicia sp. 17c TaxID=3127704 RepID=UPI00301CBF62
MKSFGICTLHTKAEELSYEQQTIYLEAQKKYDKVILINPRLVNYLFLRARPKPVILYKGKNIATLDTLMIRSAQKSEAAVAILARALKSCGCSLIDPTGRYTVGKSSKLLTTLNRFERGVGTSSYMSFTRTGATSLLKKLNEKGQMPLLTKPIDGRKGYGVEVIQNLEAGLDCVSRYFGTANYKPYPFYFQDYIHFKHEYRVMVINGEAIGIVEKVKLADKITANAAQGAEFIKADAPEIIKAVLQHVSNEGILGVDVALDQNNNIHIIETNRAPQWQTFEKVTGINVAEIIVAHTLKGPVKRKKIFGSR